MKAAVVLMAYGSPDRLADVPAYYADIRGGRPIDPAHLEHLVDRYRTLGIGEGDELSPLNAVTEATRAALERAAEVPVYTGMRHWRPRISEAVERALADGAELIVGIVLAPHYSTLSIEKYRGLLEQAIAGRAETSFVERWGSEPAFVELMAERVLAAREDDAHVVFTAHSLPARIVEAGDQYRDELLESCRLITDSAGIGRDWSFSFQSESPTGEPWLEPDILDHLVDLETRGVRRVLLCPIGFVSDHLEILWDLDVEAASRARELGLELARIEMPNADPAFIDVLAGIVAGRLAGADVSPSAATLTRRSGS